MAEDSLAVARLHLLESGLEVDYQCVLVEDYATEHAAQFDVVCCLEMLEHVPSPASVITACARLVKPGGELFFSTINRNVRAYLQAIIAGEYILGMLPRGTHDYACFIRPSELAAWLRKANVELVSMAGIGYDPWRQQYHLHDDVRVNYLLHAQRPAD